MDKLTITSEINSFSSELSSKFPGCEKAVAELVDSLQKIVRADGKSFPFSSESVDFQIFELLKCMNRDGVHSSITDLHNQFGLMEPEIINKILENLSYSHKLMSVQSVQNTLAQNSTDHDTLISLLLSLLNFKTINEDLVKYFIYMSHEASRQTSVCGGSLQTILRAMSLVGITRNVAMGTFALLTASALLVVVRFVQTVVDFVKHPVRATTNAILLSGLALIGGILYQILKFLWNALQFQLPGFGDGERRPRRDRSERREPTLEECAELYASQMDRINKQRTELRREINRNEQTLNDIQEERRQQAADHRDDLNRMNRDKDRAHDRIREDLRTAQAAVEQEIRNQREAAVARQAQFQQDLQAERQESVRVEMSRKATAVDELEQQTAQLLAGQQQLLVAARDELRTVEAETAQLNAEMEEQRGLLRESEQTHHKELQAAESKQRQVIKHLKEREAALTAEHDKVLLEVQKLTQRTQTLTREHKAQIAQATQKLEQIAQTSAEATQNLRAQKATWVQRQQEHATAEAALRERITSGTAQQEELDMQLQHWAAELDAYHLETAKASRQLEQLEQQKEVLQRENAASAQQHETAKSEWATEFAQQQQRSEEAAAAKLEQERILQEQLREFEQFQSKEREKQKQLETKWNKIRDSEKERISNMVQGQNLRAKALFVIRDKVVQQANDVSEMSRRLTDEHSSSSSSSSSSSVVVFDPAVANKAMERTKQLMGMISQVYTLFPQGCRL